MCVCVSILNGPMRAAYSDRTEALAVRFGYDSNMTRSDSFYPNVGGWEGGREGLRFINQLFDGNKPTYNGRTKPLSNGSV